MEKRIIPNEILLNSASELLAEGRDVEIMVKGYSMRPYLESEQDSVLLRKRDTVEVGDVVLAEIAPGHYVLHRVWSIEGDKVTLMGDGNCVGKERCLTRNVKGTVELFLKADGRKVKPGKGKVWRAFLPVRKYIFHFHGLYRRAKGILKKLKFWK